MAKGQEIPLAKAEAVAVKLVKAIEPWCERVAVAGSIRRRTPMVHDIDLVALPREKGRFLAALAQAGELVRVAEKTAKLNANGIPVDVYFATLETWATLLVIRTGSVQSNIYLASRARAMGMKLKADGSGVERENGTLIRCETETDLFRALELPYQRPEERK